MFPQTLLQAAQNTPVLVQVRSGQTYNGILVNKDTYMNMNLKDVTITSPTGDEFHTVPTCFIRGTQIKYVQVTNEATEAAVAAHTAVVMDANKYEQSRGNNNRDRNRTYNKPGHHQASREGNGNNNNNHYKSHTSNRPRHAQ